MTSKLTVYIDDSTKKLLKDYTGEESLSRLVNDAIESYMSAIIVRDLEAPTTTTTKEAMSFPSVSEVEKERPRAQGSSTEIIAGQRRSRNARLSRQ